MAPKSILKKATPKKRVSMSLEESMSNLTLTNGVSHQSVKGMVPFPMLSGRYTKFNHDTEVDHGYLVMRMLLHNGTQDDDFSFSWVTKRTFKIRVKWPKFMVKCMMMTGLDMVKNAAGQDIDAFPKGHQIYDSMGANAKKLKEANVDDENIWAEGDFHFDRDMKKKFETKLFEVNVGKNEVNLDEMATILQITFEETVPEDLKPKTTPLKKTRRALDLCKSPDRSCSPTRDCSPRRTPEKVPRNDNEKLPPTKKCKTNVTVAVNGLTKSNVVNDDLQQSDQYYADL